MSVELTGLQMQVMRIVWDRGEATVTEVQESLAPHRTLARTTVATLLSRLEEKGVLTHRSRDREYVYRPLVDRHEVRRSMLESFAERVFGGDVPAMMKQLLGTDTVAPEDLREVREMLARKEREMKARGREDDERGRREAGG